MKKLFHLLHRLWNFICSIFKRKRKRGKTETIRDVEPGTMPGDFIDQTLKPSTMSDHNTESHHHHHKEIDATPEFLYLYRLIYYRMRHSFKKNRNHEGSKEPPMPDEPTLPDLNEWQPHLSSFVRRHNFTTEEKILLLIAVAPYVYPALFDAAIERALKDGNAEKLNDIGGVTSRNCPFFLPTGETVIYLVNGPDINKRFEVQELFGAEHLFWEKKILWLEDLPDAEPPMHGRLIMSPDYVHQLTIGSNKSPQFSISFPAKKIAPLRKPGRKPPTLDDLVIPKDLRTQIDELISWLKHHRELKARMHGRVKKGYRTLFYGPPGTGKTFTAEILGNELNKDVYKIDLSMVVSKYIGETEKNLELLFTRAEDTGWILFFDEADALFGKRTSVRDAHDKYANQEVSYLLQRLEEYDGMCILASNYKNNIDDAFMRRFNSTLSFPIPDAEQRKMIWQKSFPEGTIFRNSLTADYMLATYDEDCRVLEGPEPFNLPEAVKKYEITGGNIINVINYAGIKAVERLHPAKSRRHVHECPDPAIEETEAVYQPRGDEFFIYYKDVLDGIRRELIKEGKPFTLYNS